MTDAPVVTGIGVTAPNGFGAADFWTASCAGRNAIDRIERFDPSSYPATLAGEVRGFVAQDHLPGRLLPQTDRMTQLALVSADWALADAGVSPSDWPEFDVGVVTASSSGGFEFGQGELQNLWSKGGQFVGAYQSFAWFYAVNTGQISIRHGLRGAGSVIVSDGAGGLDAIAQARRQIRRGARLVLAGGMDGSICPWGWVAQLAGGQVSMSKDRTRAYVPFDASASGHVPAEGGAVLALESPESARERDAFIYGEIAGHASTFDPPEASGRQPGLRRCIESALTDAGVSAADIDVVFADAAGIQALDDIEAQAIGAVFGAGGVPVTAPKTMTGRLCAGAGALDVVSALLSIRDGIIPPTINVSPRPELELDLVVEVAREMRVDTALVLARGYGGFNSAVVVRRAA